MSAYEHLKNTILYRQEQGEKEFTYSVKAANNALTEIDNRLRQAENLKAILRHVPLQVGDVVHEADYPNEKGDVVEVIDEDSDPLYRVTIRHRRKSYNYYREELELMERPGS